MLAVVFAFSAVVVAPASAKLTKAQKVHIRKQLKRAIHKNPKLIRSKSFIKKASLVNFKLPVTIRLRGSNAASNPNAANVDLGASLGQRQVNLGGSLAAEIVFHDSYDGGALGNVDLSILPSSKQLSSTSIPLLWNSDVSAPGTSWDSTLLAAAGIPSALLTAANGQAVGCGDISGSGNTYGNVPFGKNVFDATGAVTGPGGVGLPGVPIHMGGPTGPVGGFAPAHITTAVGSNVDNTIDGLTASKQLTGVASIDNNHVGGNPNPFPYTTQSDPGSFTQPPSPKDTVLRTNALKLGIATPGTEVNASTNTNDGTTTAGVNGSQNLVIGKSGGQANLFGDIPGKGYGIDVTVNLATKINSIIRVEDQDAFEPLIAGANWPAAVFSCAQIWTGTVQNYIPAVHLVGKLKISPGITADGKLRIAKATVNTPNTGTATADAARFAVAACLAPFSAYNQEVPANYAVPDPTIAGSTNADNSLITGKLPANPDQVAPAPTAPCNAPPSPLVANSALPTATVQSLTPPVTTGYSTANNGSVVSVAADLDVTNVSLDVLIGDA